MKKDTRKRSLTISNLKGLLILLVVFGHFLDLNKGGYGDEVLNLIYLFHMPLFIFVSGFLAKRIAVRKIVYFLVLYVIFQTLFLWFLWLLGNVKTPFNYAVPQFHLWYLVSLAIWYVVALGINKLQLKTVHWKIIILTVITIIALLSRWYTTVIDDLVSTLYPNFFSYSFSYQRTLSFAPFFFAGYFLTKSGFEKVSNLVKNYALKLTLIVVGLVGFSFWSYSNDKLIFIFKGSFGYEKFMGKEDTFNDFIILILVYYAVASLACIIVINLVKNRPSILTRWGDNSLYIFLLHPILPFILKELGFYHDWNIVYKLSLYGLLSICTVAFLGSTQVASFLSRRIFMPIQAKVHSTTGRGID